MTGVPGDHASVGRIFLLSPAKSSGRRAQLITRPLSNFELARQVQIGAATLGDVFAFCSGLYFRGKLAYANRFAQKSPTIPGVHVITPSRGLLLPETLVGLAFLREFSTVNVAAEEPRFTQPLQESARTLANQSTGEVVLLGSIATGKYVDTLLPILGERLVFPAEFVGRGDMSRGALLLRHAFTGKELEYAPVAGAARRGRRPAKVAPSRANR
jgi:hypothetical protein